MSWCDTVEKLYCSEGFEPVRVLSLAFPYPLPTGAYRLEILSALLSLIYKRLCWQLETSVYYSRHSYIREKYRARGRKV